MALLDTLKEVTSAAGEGGLALGRLGRLKVETTKAQARIGELYAELGSKAYRLHEKRDLSRPDLDRAKAEYDALGLKHDARNRFAARSRLDDLVNEKSVVDREPR